MSWKISGNAKVPKHKMKLITKKDRDKKISNNDFKNILLKKILKREIDVLKNELKGLKNG